MLKCLLCLLAAVLSATAADPIALDSANPHYFVFRGKPTVLVTSGEHYGAVLNRAFDYRKYLDTLAADRLNLTRTFSGTYREVPGNFAIASNTLAPAAGDYLAPWAQRGGKFDLTQWDPTYFARLKDFVAEAGKRGIVVELVLFCPLYEDSMWLASPMNARNNVQGIGDVPRNEVLSLKHPKLTEVQVAVTKKIVSELRGFDNLYYEICNEPYFQGVTLEFQQLIARTIAEADANGSARHLIAQNWANGSKVVDRPDPLVGLYNFHYSRPPESVAMNWKLGRAIGNNETGFDGGANATYRIQGWDFLMAGGALYNNLDYSFTVGHEDGSFSPPSATPGGGSATLRRQLRYLVEWFAELPFTKMQPAGADFASSPGVSVRTLEQPGELYAIYAHHGRIVKDGKPRYQVDARRARRDYLLHLPKGTWAASWRDPQSGHELKAEMVNADGAPVTLRSPEYAEDVALLLRRR